MGYYCTVPQCTSLAGKTKNVKFHRFPRDVTMADKWNIILKRGKPYTKYSKVCSLHFTQADYNVTTMGKKKGQWKTLSKDAVPSQNLPRLNPDGTVMVIRKSRTVKYRDGRKDSTSDNKSEKWSVISQSHIQNSTVADHPNIDTAHAYRSLQTLSAIASTLPPQTLPQPPIKPKKQDAIMQTDPVESEEDDSQPDNSYNEPSEPSFNEEIQYMAQYKEKEYAYKESENKKDYAPKDFTKQDDYIPRTNEEYNKEAEKYALERKSLNGFEKPAIDYHRLQDGYKNAQDMYNFDKDGVYPRNDYTPYSYQNSVELLRHQQHNIEMLQHRPSENQNFFTENDIKQEVDLSNEDDKYNMYNRKDPLDTTSVHMYTHRSVVQQQRLLDHLQHHVKQEPETSAGESVMQPQSSPYYSINGHSNNTGPYYDQLQRPPPGPESLISKQNALAAHPQLWQNMKRPFYYSEHSHYPSLHRYDDLTRILQ